MNPVLMAAGGTAFTFLMTTIGAAVVFFVRKEINERINSLFLGFAAGVMIAASVWSLLIPAIEEAEESGVIGWIPAAGGFILGALFLVALDHILPHLHVGELKAEGPRSSLGRATLLVFAVTLHNIPEGMAVGISFALAAMNAQNGADFAPYAAAFALALGIGIQNFPEGAAISLPLLKEGLSRKRAFIYGALSGIVEPIFGIAAVIFAARLTGIMPWMLSFAAGAMIFVVAEELIPEAKLDADSHMGTFGVLAGFVLMMVLDVALG